MRDVGRMIRLIECNRNVCPFHVSRNCWSSYVDLSGPQLFHPLHFSACKNNQDSIFLGEIFTIKIRTVFFFPFFVLLRPCPCILRSSLNQSALPSCVLGDDHFSFSISGGMKRTGLVKDIIICRLLLARLPLLSWL